MVTIEQIKEGAKFKINRGTVFIIDHVDSDNLVRSSIEGDKKGDYRDEIKDIVLFLNENGGVLCE